MQLLRRYPGRTAAIVVGLVLAAACTDRSNPVTPTPGGGGPATPGKPIPIAMVACRAVVATRTVACDQPVSGGARGLIVGGQNVYVTVGTSNVNYDGGTQAFTFNTTVRNLIPQALGTTDGVTLDPSGVRIFFLDGPTVTSGTGAVTVTPDGVGTFTEAGQPYYQYNAVLDQFEISSPKTWQLNIPATVGSFDFMLMVAAAVQYEDGWVEVTGNPVVRSGNERTLTAIVRSPVGNIDSLATITDWTTSPADAQLADFISETGETAVVHGYRFGAPVMNVSASRVNYAGATVTVNGSLTLSVLARRRDWTGATNGDWFTGTNWSPDNVVPVAQDSAAVTDTVTTFPTLNANASIGGVDVLDLTPGGTVPTIDLAAFNLTASGSVATTNSAAITNTSGTLVLTGIAQDLQGTIPFFNITGTYSLTGNLTARARGRVQAGRLRNTSFRVRITSN